MDNNLTFLNACRNGQKSIVQIFLKGGGIDVNKRDAEGNTPLHYACQKGFRDIAVLLLDNGDTPTVVNNRSESALHAVARCGNKEIIARLLWEGAEVDATDREGRTPLLCLLSNKHTDAALYLINQGANTELADNIGHRAIDYATAYGLREVVLHLSIDNAGDARGNTPLHQAVRNGQGEIVRTLLAVSAAMLDTLNDDGETPLAIACIKGDLMIATMLVEKGADVNKAMLNGSMPLHFAARSGNQFLGKLLLEAKARTDVQNENGDTPLIVAAREGNHEFVSLLVEYRADVNLANNLRHTALHYAVERGYNEIVETLLVTGAEG